MRDDRAHLLPLLDALDAATRCLRRDACDAYAIIGKDGHIYADGAAGYLICATTGESAPRRWNFIRKQLAPFCRVTQDGDIDGCLQT